jgi:methylthioribose-1-phosphate isomerase
MTSELLAPFDRVRALRFDSDGFALLDQRALPQRSDWLPMADAPAVAEAIHALTVRGAPAIGIAAGWGVVLAGARGAGAARRAIAALALAPAMLRASMPRVRRR